MVGKVQPKHQLDQQQVNIRQKQAINLIQNALPPKKAGFHLISAIQAKRALCKGKDQFLVAFIKDTQTSETAAHPQAKDLLVEFADVFPDKLPNKLPPEREIDHRIKLETNTICNDRGVQCKGRSRGSYSDNVFDHKPWGFIYMRQYM